MADLLFILCRFSCFAYVETTTMLLVWSNLNQSNRRSMILPPLGSVLCFENSPHLNASQFFWFRCLPTYLWSWNKKYFLPEVLHLLPNGLSFLPWKCQPYPLSVPETNIIKSFYAAQNDTMLKRACIIWSDKRQVQVADIKQISAMLK